MSRRFLPFVIARFVEHIRAIQIIGMDYTYFSIEKTCNDVLYDGSLRCSDPPCFKSAFS